MTKAILLCALLCSSFCVSAQTSLQRVNKQMELGAYDLAIPGYMEIIQNDPSHQEAMIQLALAHAQINEHFDAVKWFSKALAQGQLDAEHLLAYGHSLKAQERYVDAQQIYAMVTGEQAYIASHYLLSCDRARELAGASAVGQSTSLQINSRSADFSPVVHDDQLVYSSFRKDVKWNTQTAKSLANSAESSNHFVVDVNGLTERTMPSTPAVTQAYPQHSSPFSIAEDASLVVFAKNFYQQGVRQIDGSESGVGLYTASLSTAGDWTDIQPWSHNSSQYSNNYPHISADGTKITFASNRPGGYGNYDLYESVRTATGWSEPVNLGPAINTAGNEVTPQVDGGTLYFSSDWHFGLGGMDIFKAEKEGDEWMPVRNLGAAINSPLDDYSYTPLSADRSVYVSNRPGGYGAEDLYLYSSTDMPLAAVSTQQRLQARQSLSQVQTKPSVSGPAAGEVVTSTAVTSTAVMSSSSSSAGTSVTPIPRATAPTVTSRSSSNEPSATSRPQHLVQVLDKDIILIVQDKTGNRIKDARVDMSECGESGATTNEYGKATVSTSRDCKVSVSAPGYLRAIVKLADGYVNADGKKTVTLVRDTESNYSYSNTTSYGSTTVSSPNSASSTSIYDVVTSTTTTSPTTSSYTETATTSYADASQFYTVQVAAFDQYSSQLDNYTHLDVYGTVYSHDERGMTKIRIGKFVAREKAAQTLDRLKARGYADAFIVSSNGSDFRAVNTSTVGTQDYTSGSYSKPSASTTAASTHSSSATSTTMSHTSSTTSTPAYTSGTTTTTYSDGKVYKIRLAAYSDIKWFDTNKVSDLGTVEQWNSNEYTVMILGNLSSLQDAQQKLATVKSRGFNDARIVTDDNGILRYVK